MADAFIGASIANIRLLSEIANVMDCYEGGKKLKMTDQSVIESAWTIHPQNGSAILSITPALNTVFLEEETDTIFISYVAKHVVTFNVFSFTGFDPTSEIPQVAVRPYLDMALFIARSRATTSVRNMGLPNFIWPVAENFEEVLAADVPAPKKTAKRIKAKTISK